MIDESGPVKVLIADDNDADRMILNAIVQKQGHLVVMARDGAEAVDKFESERPHIVLLDVLMPKMDGYEAARRIKEIAGEELVPIIFLTSIKDVHALAECLDAGGDDFMSKPYNRVILEAKLKAFNRMRGMHATLQHQRDQIAIHNEHLVHEQEVAKAVFDNVAHLGCLNAKNIKYLLSPLAVFNGDVLLATRKPSGGMYVLLGDFTGHGLPAAIGAMPMAEIFYGMAIKGFSMRDILREINQKLKNILPVSVFCCACMVDMDFRKNMIKVWLGGLPDCFLYRAESKEFISIGSRNLPLGVLDNDFFKDDMQIFEMTANDRLYIWSDGIHEACNVNQEMYGEERLVEVFRQAEKADDLFDSIKNSVTEFIGNTERSDDITMVEVKMVEEEYLKDTALIFPSSKSDGPTDWAVSYELRDDTLKTCNPLPLLLHIIMEVPGLHPFSGEVYTILAELYSNALEHGVINLKSEMKSTPLGFAKYYSERSRLLRELKNGFVRFHLSHKPSVDGGNLIIRVEDSGPGFGYDKFDNPEKSLNAYCGRGIALIQELCKSLQFVGAGNIVEVDFEWKQ